MSAWIYAPLCGVLIALLATWCTTGSRARRNVGIALGVCVLLPPWLLPERPYIVRGVWALAAFTTMMRVTDLASMQWDLGRRIVHVMSVVDSRRLVKRAPRFEIATLGKALAWATLGAAGIAAIPIARWPGGVVAAYAEVSALYVFLKFSYSAFGFDTPVLHDSPIFARSVQELWGERWAQPISDWLSETIFRPFARRRRARTGVLLAFGVSAAFHAYAVWVGLGFRRGLTMTAWMFGYFISQALVMGLERMFGVKRWRPIAGHVWTIAWMLALSPLFVEPLVRVLDFSWR